MQLLTGGLSPRRASDAKHEEDKDTGPEETEIQTHRMSRRYRRTQ